jgi:hypothetical protein
LWQLTRLISIAGFHPEAPLHFPCKDKPVTIQESEKKLKREIPEWLAE